MESLSAIIVTVALYFLPTIVASGRGKSNAVAIGVLNLLLGWTLIGWVVAMVWACTSEGQRSSENTSTPTEASAKSNSIKAIVAIVIGIGILGGIGAYNHETSSGPSGESAEQAAQ